MTDLSWKERAEKAEARVDELEKLVYVPGMWKCPKCACITYSTNLHYPTGGFSANNDPQRCPNDCGPMWRVTERDAGNNVCDRLEAMQRRAEKAEAVIEAARAWRERLKDVSAGAETLAPTWDMQHRQCIANEAKREFWRALSSLDSTKGDANAG